MSFLGIVVAEFFGLKKLHGIGQMMSDVRRSLNMVKWKYTRKDEIWCQNHQESAFIYTIINVFNCYWWFLIQQSSTYWSDLATTLSPFGANSGSRSTEQRNPNTLWIHVVLVTLPWFSHNLCSFCAAEAASPWHVGRTGWSLVRMALNRFGHRWAIWVPSRWSRWSRPLSKLRPGWVKKMGERSRWFILDIVSFVRVVLSSFTLAYNTYIQLLVCMYALENRLKYECSDVSEWYPITMGFR